MIQNQPYSCIIKHRLLCKGLHRGCMAMNMYNCRIITSDVCIIILLPCVRICAKQGRVIGVCRLVCVCA